MYVTLVHIHVIPDYRDAFITATRDNHLASVQEPGNLRFDVLQSPEDSNYFVLIEAYKSREDAVAHKETAHYKRWRDSVADWMAEPRQGIPFTGLYPQFG